MNAANRALYRAIEEGRIRSPRDRKGTDLGCLAITLTRDGDYAVTIGDVTVTLLESRNNRAQLAIECPRSIKVVRKLAADRAAEKAAESK